MRMPDAPSRLSVARAPSPPTNPEHVPLARASSRAANSRARFSATAALSPRSAGGSRTTTSGNAALQPRDLRVRHGIQRADLKKDTGFRLAGIESGGAARAAMRRIDSSRPDQTSRYGFSKPARPDGNHRGTGRGNGLRNRHQVGVGGGIETDEWSATAGSSSAMSLVLTGVTGSRPIAVCIDRLAVHEQPTGLDRSSHQRIRRAHEQPAHLDAASATPQALQRSGPAPTRASSNRFSGRYDRRPAFISALQRVGGKFFGGLIAERATIGGDGDDDRGLTPTD